jgi:hypothetical protein
MTDDSLLAGGAVGATHHNHHDHHMSTPMGETGDGCDVGDDGVLLFDVAQSEMLESQPTLTPHDNPIELIEEALLRLKHDVGVLAEEAVVQAFSVLHATDLPSYLRLRHQAKVINRDCSLTILDKLVRQELPSGGEEPSAIDELIELGREQCQLHHDADRNAVAIIPTPDCQEVWRVQSTGYEAWLRAAYWRSKQSGVSDMTLKAALATLCAAGVNDGNEVTVHIRAATDTPGYLIDLCDAQWRAIQVTPSGWRVLDPSPMLFTRTQSMRSLPVPERGADIELLWQHVNIPAERRVMVLTWLLDCLRPDTPFPVLELVGEQGSAKSTTQSVLRSLVDPNKVMLRGRPKTVEDIFVAAANNWLVSYENLSGLTAEQQDALCTLATGGGFASRQLYTNGEEHVMETKRPVVLNGISVLASRPDLIDRVIHVDLPVISADARKDDADTRAQWERDRPLVFGALLDLFARALCILPTVRLTQKQRMADYERFGEAVGRALGLAPGEFQRQYAELVSAGIDRALEGNAVAQALDKALGIGPYPWKWNGTAGQLYDLLGNHNSGDRSNWPRSPKGLSDQLRRIAPAYRAKGIEITPGGHSREGALWRISPDSTPTSFNATPPGVTHRQEGGIRYGQHRE